MIIEQPGAMATNHYYDPYFAKEAVKILPGEYYATATDELIVTVLGSCIAVCLRDHLSGVGGMNHFMLPRPSDETLSAADSPRYGMFAMESLIKQLLHLGAQRERFEAKVFGGGSVVPDMTENDVGQCNVDFVHAYLNQTGIPLAAEDVLGQQPRKIYFFPASGQVLMKKLKRLHNCTLLEREQEFDLSLKRAASTGPIELF